MARKSKVYSLLTNEEFIALATNSKSYSDMLRSLGLSTNGGNSLAILKRRLAELNVSVEHFKTNNGPSAYIVYSLEQILVKDSTYQNRARLKIRLVNEGILKYECNICGLSEWRDLPISLQLDHKNGINNDNRINNLRLLCPNCHSQTDTFSGKNTYRG